MLFCLVGLPRGTLLRVLGVVILGCVPLLPGLIAVLGEPGTFRQPPLEPSLVLLDLRARFGFLGLLWLVPAALGARERPVAALALCGTVILLGAFVFLGIAAPHQFPYLLFLGPPLALLVEAGSRRSRGLVLALALVQGTWVGAFDGLRLQALMDDVSEGGRAVDLAWAESAEAVARGEDVAVVLLSPAGVNDDDKRATSAVIWRLRPWWSMPPALEPGVTWSDHRLGQPRRVAGRTVYLDDHVRPQLASLVAQHRRVWVVVSEPGQRAEYTTSLQALLGAEPDTVGIDLLYRLSPVATGGASAPSD